LVRRITDRGLWQYEWDATDNLRRVTTPDHVVEMLYDGRGRRMQKTVLVDGEESILIRYVWDNQILLREVNETTGWTRTYLRNEADWAPFGHVDSDDRQEVPCFYFGDRSGLPDFALDASGNTVWAAERSVYGDVRVDPTSSVDVRVRFAGQLYDEHVGLVYNRMRWYEPRTAQYVLPDRLGLDGGLNFRDYVPNPTTFVDPMGEAAHKPTPGAQKPQGSYPSGWGDRPPKPTSTADMTSSYMTQPGHWATEGTDGVPGSVKCSPEELKAAGHGGDKGEFSADTTKAIDAAGSKYGCHTCGSKNPLGPDAGQDEKSLKAAQKQGVHFVPDHIPAAALHTPRGKNKDHEIDVPDGGVRLFPQCRVCSNRQKNDVNAVKHGLRAEGDNDEQKIAAVNAKAQDDFTKNQKTKPPTPVPTAKSKKKSK